MTHDPTPPKSRKRNAATAKPTDGFTDAERAAMQAREAGERDVLAKIAEMSEPDRSMARQLHALILATAPTLSPKTWYGMPAYAKDGKVLCFFQGAEKFKTRYATLGFSDVATLDHGNLWPVAFALEALTDTEAAQIAALLQQALS